jgi:hypothetical protein
MAVGLVTALGMALLGASPSKLVQVSELPKFPVSPGSVTVLSPVIRPGFEFDEVVPSWNVKNAGTSTLRVRLRAASEDKAGAWFDMGTWTLGASNPVRTSVDDQKNDEGTVLTDILRLKIPASGVQVEWTLTLQDPAEPRPDLSLFALSFRSRATEWVPDVAEKTPAWGKTIDVPQRAQGNYPRGGVLCSPTSLSMVLWHWSNVLNRPDLNQDVPEVTSRVWDHQYDGAGNWTFNVAYAGSFPGLQAYVDRLESIQDLEKWIQAGVPVITSVCLNRLQGKDTQELSGHLVVLVGFTETGDPVMNDPAFRAQVRRTYRRADFLNAWRTSGQTVYLVKPTE